MLGFLKLLVGSVERVCRWFHFPKLSHNFRQFAAYHTRFDDGDASAEEGVKGVWGHLVRTQAFFFKVLVNQRRSELGFLGLSYWICRLVINAEYADRQIKLHPFLESPKPFRII